MKLVRVAIDGYGRLLDRTIEFTRGIQIVLGPNEQGKSTLRSYIADMLYGQKRSVNQRLYEDANELRCPWDNPEAYGGSLVYELDDGRTIEVHRRFDRKSEMVQVFDLTHGQEITAEFEQLRNREPNFAQAHLGISKEIFLNTATIGHSALDVFGDESALVQLREKLQTLADSGDEATSADAAIKRIESRIAAIGQANARTRPLPAAKTRLAELDAELQGAAALRHELEEIEMRRRALIAQCDTLRQQVNQADNELAASEIYERATRLQEAESFEMQIQELTRQCFILREAAQFPLELRADVQRAAILVSTAEDTLRRLRQEREQRSALGGAGDTPDQPGAGDIPEQLDHQLVEADENVKAVRLRCEAAEKARAAAAGRLTLAENELAALPDFNRAADDPVTWLGQLAGSFRIALRFRDEECAKRDGLREKLQKQKDAIAASEALFASIPEFETTAREYEVRKRMREEQTAHLEQEMETLKNATQELGARIPGFTWLAILMGVILVALFGAFFILNNSGVLVTAAMVSLAMVYFIGKMVHERVQYRQALKQLDDAESRIVSMCAGNDEQTAAIELMMTSAQCQTVRELEARYDVYRKSRMELDALLAAAEEVEGKALDAEERVRQMLESYTRMFANVGETLTGEADVEQAASRAIARYQSYRDAKRRGAENRDLVKRHEAELAELTQQLDAAREESVQLGLTARQLMREHGYADESKHDTAIGALRSYRIRRAQLHEKRRTIAQTLTDLERAIDAEEQSLQQHRQTVEKMLAAARVQSLEQWHERARQAEQYRDVRLKLDSITGNMATVLRGQDLRTLRAAVEADPPTAGQPAQSVDDIRARRRQFVDELETAAADQHALQLELAQKSAGMRPLCEVEEERAILLHRIAMLENELEAAAYAKALIESIARDKHSRIAPKLAALAAGYLGDITAGRYGELTVSRDMKISIRVPQTRRMHEDPEKLLSKGTTDQVFLALRLAMIQCISEKGETIPMLLDDPFPNYDDERLHRALTLLSQVAQRHQVLLFTCREDVVEAAKEMGMPILAL